MDYSTLAHAGGLDEMAIILFPLLVGGGVWLMTRGAGPKDKAKKPPTPPPAPKAPPVRFTPADPKGKRPPQAG
ncbi:MAG TPA: hypothetical protein VJS45_02950 [Acidimicrobiia bacterium]|jgi:hypothetical protein|nr:hypothetical protein [Acidimicrobiia bacterium]